ncbi:MAG TPA: adenylate/guanylate cyclase domain-containing protein [Candidatus Dormibacteraeota bacterium]|nr:adenylate/guanylate cyclase domain-containing protein [Candidatus Dormibacteraeota bacterium]
MTQLGSKARDQLPNSAFAYVDSQGRRRLPINDEGHVRNALSRFNQTAFEDDAARDRARTRLLKAAKKYGIVPVGFMTGQLRNVRIRGESEARASEVRTLPTGFVTFLLADVEDSTGLVRRLGDGYSGLLADLRRLLRAAVRASGGREVDARADELFAVFKHAPAALNAALVIQRKTLARAWPTETQVKVRVGLHSGRPTLTDTGYVGLSVHTAARICFAGHGGQIVLSRAAREAVEGHQPVGVGFRDLGLHPLQGLPAPEALFQVEAADLPVDFPAPRTLTPQPASARRRDRPLAAPKKGRSS